MTEMHYADDNATPAVAEELQQTADIPHETYRGFGMEVNTDKTKVLAQYAPGHPEGEEELLSLGGYLIEAVSSFPYLGSLLSTSATCAKT